MNDLCDLSQATRFVDGFSTIKNNLKTCISNSFYLFAKIKKKPLSEYDMRESRGNARQKKVWHCNKNFSI